ncbi:MAG TPA: glycosyltransferase [Prolixibacteraceae bacterium]|jgi:glycosyltransferase involved in cell wall biosynthesis
MKILWLTETPSKYKPEEFGYNGRGWIESLQSLLEKSTEIDQLGIVFPHSLDSEKLIKGRVTYYPIKSIRPGHIVSWIISNWKNKIEHENEIYTLKAIIEEFEPDVIHIFGTESWLCHAVEMTNKPCVVHLQGLLLPYLNAYIPAGISTYDLMKVNWIGFIKGISIWHHRRVFDKKSKREYKFFKEISYFMGRTIWDKSISRFLSPKSIYFHVDEVLRDKFYSTTPWRYNKKNKAIITSTLSDALYKGLDLVIKTSALLMQEKFEFEWRIIGVTNHSKSALLLRKVFNSDYSSLNISLMGIKNTFEIIDLLSETTLYIHTSSIDNSPNSLCEAQIVGLPVIATNVGGVSSLIEDGKDGFLVPANDPYFLASKIVELCNNPVLLKTVSGNAREKAQKRHSKDEILNQLIKTYQQLSTNNKEEYSSKVKIPNSLINF